MRVSVPVRFDKLSYAATTEVETVLTEVSVPVRFDKLSYRYLTT